MAKSITIIGAGLVGSFLSLQLQKLGHQVRLIEKRPDMRKTIIDGGRSINLIVTSRGLNAARHIGIEKELLEITVPVTGRMIHDLEGNTKFQPYGRDESECNYSISRGEMNQLLLNLAENSGVEIEFDCEITDVDIPNAGVTVNGEKITCDHLFGADGGGSAVRKSLSQYFTEQGIKHENRSEMLGADYKELLMPLKKDGTPPLETHALHIWPRGSFMLMALPNLDSSFTMTLYLPQQGELSFDSLDNNEKVTKLFHSQFLSAVKHMPHYLEEWNQNPVGTLGTVRCNLWNHQDKVTLIGDAAHAIVPFFGQGMNCGLEDCFYLGKYLQESSGNFAQAIENYAKMQIPNAYAIADMAIENYDEMKSKVGDDRFLLRKSVEHKLENLFPEQYRSRYGLVTYTLTPYAQVQEIGKANQFILDELTKNITTVAELDIDKAKKLLTSVR
tara:strand:+ start:165486 stop:166820 length:1335 start_codon:yes stop_codon:yes gene_type:complete